ncbi:unnamed protein product [Cladocopium goreaui]|uniref:Dual-specificity RNA methyltransferase RlmN n=1 Tax=Cladocopium goreaui TaxID=2562237 RepID=A0A9P1BV28_9DINO|nr:unnamed protein product [Cladocopium goreaui]
MPKRIRRQRPESFSFWDFPALLQFLDSLDVKRSHAPALLRTLASKLVTAGGANADCDTWEALGVIDETLLDLGLPRKACELLTRTKPFSTRLSSAMTSSDQSTCKMVLDLWDGHKVESVIMRHEDRTTICVSSQVGCQMGCTFCATGTLPIVGDLDAGEIVEQLLLAQRLEFQKGLAPVRNCVFMGMGEPLNNYDAVVSAVRSMTGLGQLGAYALPQSRVTISTVGVVPRMKQLVRDLPGLSLALSLHAPTQELREKIVPSAKHVSMEDLLSAMDLHLEQKTARAMIEYVLLSEENDSDLCATQLGKLLAPRARKIMVNLIPYNPTASGGFQAPKHQRVERFQQILAHFGIMTRVRREMGQDIAGACGQLALKESETAEDLEDFVQWRRRQPKNSKQMVSAECEALVAAALEVDAASPLTQEKRLDR